MLELSGDSLHIPNKHTDLLVKKNTTCLTYICCTKLMLVQFGDLPGCTLHSYTHLSYNGCTCGMYTGCHLIPLISPHKVNGELSNGLRGEPGSEEV